jgi:hypothetical protein
MKQFYSINEGEYLVGLYINEKVKECEIWFPAKDNGTDILLTSKNDHKKNVSIQVKYSKAYLSSPKHSSDDRNHYRSCGFWDFGQTAVKSSMDKCSVDFWIIAIHSFFERETDFIVITSAELYKRFSKFKKEGKKPSTYFWITKDKKCFETRGLNSSQKKLLKEGKYDSFEPERNFTSFLNNWKLVKQFLGV